MALTTNEFERILTFDRLCVIKRSSIQVPLSDQCRRYRDTAKCQMPKVQSHISLCPLQSCTVHLLGSNFAFSLAAPINSFHTICDFVPYRHLPLVHRSSLIASPLLGVEGDSAAQCHSFASPSRCMSLVLCKGICRTSPSAEWPLAFAVCYALSPP